MILEPPYHQLVTATILGLVEGATEFIPVSSTGHLIVASEWLGFTGERAKTFDVFIQLGAILAIVWLYRARLFGAIGAWQRDAASARLLLNLAVAFVPAAAVGFLTHGWIREHLFTTRTVAWALVVGGVLILLLERLKPKTSVHEVDEIPFFTALGIGLAQVLALFPGTSRSGATIMGGYALGLSRPAATEFSFFMAVPIMLVATLFDLYKGWSALAASDLPVFAVGFAVAFVSALVVVRFFLAYVSRHSFAVFAVYRIVAGVLLLLWAARGG